MAAGRWVAKLEHVLETAHLRDPSAPEQFRIDSYEGHGGPAGVVVRGRALDNPPPSQATEGEGLGPAVRRGLQHFRTRELPGVMLTIRVAGESVTTTTDDDGYFVVRLPAGADLVAPWTPGTIEVARPFRGMQPPPPMPLSVRVPAAGASFGIISDIDDTVIETGVQRVGRMLVRTLTGSELTRVPFPGAADLYRDLAAEINPVFYVSSSPWNLHAFLRAFLHHHDFPRGPLFLRDLLGTSAGREQKHGRIREIFDLHPGLPFVLIGDSGEKDPQIYADIVQSHPGRVLAVYIREVRLDPGDGRVERVVETWGRDVPFVLAADSLAVRRHAETLGLL
ncbi:MAG: phosphatase [Aeromicrobium sp.]|nr:phosphatase [Aeromicrobium sp.]